MTGGSFNFGHFHFLGRIEIAFKLIRADEKLSTHPSSSMALRTNDSTPLPECIVSFTYASAPPQRRKVRGRGLSPCQQNVGHPREDFNNDGIVLFAASGVQIAVTASYTRL